MERIAKGEATKDDITKINSRVITPKHNSIKAIPDPCYACAKNSERNSISADVFSQHVQNSHQNSLKIPTHTIIIESSISASKQMGKKHSSNHHATVYNTCGDCDVTSSFGNKHIDPVLKLYTGIPIMLNSNEHIEHDRGNGTLARFKKVVLKEDRMLKTKIWDGHHINTVSVDDVKFIVCEHWKDNVDNNIHRPQRYFKLYPEVTKVEIKMNLFGSKKKLVFGNQYIKQFGILVNTATTGHKLQGLSMDYIIIVSWFYGSKNWVYVVLSRVRKLSGLYLFKPLDFEKYFKQDNKLTKHIRDLARIEKTTLSSIDKIQPIYGNKSVTQSILSNSKIDKKHERKSKTAKITQTPKTSDLKCNTFKKIHKHSSNMKVRSSINDDCHRVVQSSQ